MEQEQKVFHITITYTNGTSSCITHRRAKSKKEAFLNEINSKFNTEEEVFSISVVEVIRENSFA